MTIEAAGSSSTSGTDTALLAEIPPAMLAKLELDGRLYGYLILIVALTIIPTLGLTAPITESISAAFELGSGGARRLADGGYLFGLFGGCLFLPWYFKRSCVRAELKYRRQHGKWRWER
jgi:hypothetical protein